MWFFVLFLLFQEGAQINIFVYFGIGYLFLKNAKHNIFVNHTNLLYSVQIKMIFFLVKNNIDFVFSSKKQDLTILENRFHIQILKLVFFLIYQLISLPSWAMWPRIPLINIKLDLYRVHLLCNFEASNIIKPE